uniref:Uncharacterized protein n=1 Tax=Heliothis virescens TaxID=7102 RepID=A0A2A4JZZ7_HELVI
MCLSAGYDIARSDRNCVCKCYKDSTKELYFKHIDKKWKLPTTKKPLWAGGELKLVAEEEEGVITQEGFDILNHPSTEIRVSRTTPSTETEQKSVKTGNETANAVSMNADSLTTVGEAGHAANSDDVTSANEDNNKNADDSADVTAAIEDNTEDADHGSD